MTLELLLNRRLIIRIRRHQTKPISEPLIRVRTERTVKLTVTRAAHPAIGDGEVQGWDGLLAVTGADRLSVPPKAVGASFFARKRWSSNRGTRT